MLPAHKLLIEGVSRECFFPREIPSEHAEQKYTESPHISAVVYTQALLPAGVAQFWSRVRDGSAHPLHWRASAPRHAKVRQFHLPALLVKDEDVLWLYVTMHQLLAVQVIQCDRHLVHTPLGNVLRQSNLRPGERKEYRIRRYDEIPCGYIMGATINLTDSQI